MRRRRSPPGQGIDSRIAGIEGILDPSKVITDPEELVVYECDATTIHRQRPAAVVLPSTRDEVVRVVQFCDKRRIPFVPRGAGTSLSGGAVPSEGSVVVDLNRMNRIIEIDAENLYAVVEPGVRNFDITRAVSRHGLFYAPDPSSQKASTIGGNVAENAGGPRCLKYGVTTDHVLGLEIVMPDGGIIKAGGPVADGPGYDLVGLFVGSEGTLGIATKVWVRLVPAPEAVQTSLAIYTRLEDACSAVAEIIRRGIVPAALEIIDRNTIEAVEASVYAAGYPRQAGAVLLVEIDGVETGLERTAREIRAITEAKGAIEFHAARDLAERERLWKGRKGAFGAMGRLSTDLYTLDATVPRSKLADVVRRVVAIGRKHGVTLSNVFHAGDGNLHPNLSYDGRDAEETRRVIEAGREIISTCLAAGGTISGEHGVGNEKLEFMPLLFSREDLDLLGRVRLAFDPQGISNPGKVLPEGTAGRMAEIPANDRGPGGPAARHGAAGHTPATAAPGREAVAAPVTGTYRAASREEISDAVRGAEAAGTALVPSGFGNRLHIGNPVVRASAILSLDGMDRVVDYEPEDLVIGVEAGIAVSRLAAILAENGQEVPLDLPSKPLSVGSLLSTSFSGPRRGRWGGARAHVIGMEVIIGGGRMIRSGGMVVKNVAGYDLGKLLIGSFGTLGAIVRANLRLRALPEMRIGRVYAFGRDEDAWSFAHRVRGAMEASAITVLGQAAWGGLPEACRPGDGDGASTFVWCLFEDIEEAARSMASRADGMLPPGAWRHPQDTGAASDFLRTLTDFQDPDRDTFFARLSVLPSRAGKAFGRMTALLREAHVVADVPSGVLLVRMPPDHRGGAALADELVGGIEAVRRQVRGHARIHLPADHGGSRDSWLDPPPAETILRRLKAAFDPVGIFSPGRFAGRI